MRAIHAPGHNEPVTTDPPPSWWRRLRVLRPEGPQPRLTRRNWAFDVLLVVVFIVVALSGTDITGHLFETTSDGAMVVRIPEIQGVPAIPVPPYEAQPINPQGPGWIAVAAILPLLLRRRYPLATLMVILGITVVSLHGEMPGTDMSNAFEQG